MYNFGFNRYGGTPPVVKNLLIINVIMMLATWVFSSKYAWDLNATLGLYYFGSELFKPYQLITYMFMHSGLMHIFFNMFALWMFGKILESVWGGKRFLIYYLVTGVGAALIQQSVTYFELHSIFNQIIEYAQAPSLDAFELFVKNHISHPSSYVESFISSWQTDVNSPIYINQSIQIVHQYYTEMMNVPMVGASGAVYGILLAFGMLFPNTELMLLFPPIPIKAKYMVFAYGAIELYLGLSQDGSNIAHFAHLGGMLFGFILIKIWNKRSPNFY
jgi:membrane associated rhomboid family serine protease